MFNKHCLRSECSVGTRNAYFVDFESFLEFFKKVFFKVLLSLLMYKMLKKRNFFIEKKDFVYRRSIVPKDVPCIRKGGMYIVHY